MPEHSVLIIGCGSIGERHLRCFQQSGRCRVTVCDTRPELLERITRDYAIPTSNDWRTASATAEVDIAVICTPAPSHVAIAQELLARGIHVLIEKPLSHSLQDVATLIASKNSSRCCAGVAYVYRVFPVLQAAHAFLKTDQLGTIRQATVISGQPFHLLRPGYSSTYYREHQSGGGAIQDALTHFANWMEGVLGPTLSLLCDCSHQVLPDVEVEDTVHIAARHESALVNYSYNQFQLPNETTIQFNAAGGSLKIEFHTQRWGVCLNAETDWTWHDCPVPERDAHFTAQAHAFMDAVEGKSPVPCTLEEAAQTLRFNLAALAASTSDQRVHCASLHA